MAVGKRSRGRRDGNAETPPYVVMVYEAVSEAMGQGEVKSVSPVVDPVCRFPWILWAVKDSNRGPAD
jgi:hypothetical protein